jgi:hypothetical protein
VESAIRGALALPPDQWLDLACLRGEDQLPSEALVYLIRHIQHTDANLFGHLIWQLSVRIARIAKKWSKGFDPDTTDEIVFEVEKVITDLVIAPTVSRQSEFLEIAFGVAVKRRTLNSVEKRRNAPLPLQGGVSQWIDSDEVDAERSSELVVDDSPSTDELVEQLQDHERRGPLLRRAQSFVKDIRHYEALLLFYGFGWPISSQDETFPALEKYFNVSGRQIQNWMKDGVAAIRKGFGERS